MKELPNPATMTLSISNILSVSPKDEDHGALEQILQDVAGVAQGRAAWLLTRARTLACARAAFQHTEYAAVLCERDLPPDSWKDLLETTQQLRSPPLVIVTSRHADEYLWAEALNLGAHDVLAKPYYASEVIRVIHLACLRWQRERRLTPRPDSTGMAKYLAAAGNIAKGA